MEPISGKKIHIVHCLQPQRPAGQWRLITPLLVGPRTMRFRLINAITKVATDQPVRVLDAGYLISDDELMAVLHLKSEAWKRVNYMRADSCSQVLMALEDAPTIGEPFFVLDLLRTFYNKRVPIEARKRLLQSCLENLNRLEKYMGALVYACPPETQTVEAAEIFKMVEEAAEHISWIVSL